MLYAKLVGYLMPPTDEAVPQSEFEFMISTLEIYGLPKGYMKGDGHFPNFGKEGKDDKLATFCTGPAIRSYGANLVSAVVGTFMLVYPVLLIAEPTITFTDVAGQPLDGTVGLQTLGALPVALVVFAIGLGLGGPTGYAINPARDLGPRIAHALLPVPGKRDSDWGYAAIPVVGPLLGGALAAIVKVTLY